MFSHEGSRENVFCCLRNSFRTVPHLKNYEPLFPKIIYVVALGSKVEDAEMADTDPPQQRFGLKTKVEGCVE